MFTRHTFIAGLILGLALVIVGGTPSDAATYPGYHPCKQEDSAGPCYWNATTRGNGHGQSFIVTRHGRVLYLDGALRRCDDRAVSPTIRAADRCRLAVLNLLDGPRSYRVKAGPNSHLLPDAHRCGHGWCLDVGPWRHVGQPLADSLAEGGSPDADTRKWERCYRDRIDGVGVVIACGDGYLELA